jgi:hypothetical protein
VDVEVEGEPRPCWGEVSVSGSGAIYRRVKRIFECRLRTKQSKSGSIVLNEEYNEPG